jgi:uncharacterized protein DUF4440
MKPILVLALVAITSVAFGQTTDTSQKQSGKVEQTLMHIEQELIDAGLKGDTSAIERYVADTATYTSPDGEVLGKTRSVAEMKSGELKVESSKLEDMKVQLYKDTAIVTYASTDKGMYKGKDVSGRYRWTDVFMKRGRNWQLVAGHGSRIAQQ